MKKIFIALVFVLALTCSFSAFADYQTVDVYVNGEVLVADSPAILVDSRTMVPLRAISEKLGCDVGWDGDTQTAEIKNSKTAVYVTIDSDKLVKKDLQTKKIEEIIIDAPAMLYKQRTLIPLRAVSEALDAKVEWDSERECALITTDTIKTLYGEVTEKGYVSELLGIDYVAPDGTLTIGYNDNIKVSDFAENVDKVDEETVLEFETYYKKYLASISIAVSPQTPVMPAEYLEYFRFIFEGTHDEYTYHAATSIEDVEISGIEFKRLAFVVQSETDKLKTDYYAGKVGDRLVIAVTVYKDEAKEKADELINALKIAQ
ncbi:MAG: copper amine oxidase N-terminal domain-containing protein [Clostridia bacterium]|nr:copper amine oxidase N-terminal domain-containing protein [Clostridia bacterium]